MLTLTLKGCSNLLSADSNDKSDPYVVVKAAGSKTVLFKTKVQKKVKKKERLNKSYYTFFKTQ